MTESSTLDAVLPPCTPWEKVLNAVNIHKDNVAVCFSDGDNVSQHIVLTASQFNAVRATLLKIEKENKRAKVKAGETIIFSESELANWSKHGYIPSNIAWVHNPATTGKHDRWLVGPRTNNDIIEAVLIESEKQASKKK